MGLGVYLVYDGACGFCARCVDWGMARWGGEVTAITSADFLSQSSRLSRTQVSSSVWWVEPGAQYHGAAAVARALAATSSPWRILGRIGMTWPLPWLVEPGYRIVARFRHRLPGGSEACRAAR